MRSAGPSGPTVAHSPKFTHRAARAKPKSTEELELELMARLR
jgi:hypothetical protein